MSGFRIDQQARRDLKEIYRYIAKDNRPAAARLIEQFYEKFGVLASHPLIGPLREDLSPDLRIFPVRSYVILYRRPVLELRSFGCSTGRAICPLPSRVTRNLPDRLLSKRASGLPPPLPCRARHSSLDARQPGCSTVPYALRSQK